MPWHTGKPAADDFLSVSVQHIRENFAELEPLQPHIDALVNTAALAPHVDALVDTATLAPHVDALADIAPHVDALADIAPHVDALKDTAALAPHVDALLSSRIVEHNLDVTNPPNGYYIRWANGFQLCLHWLTVPQGSSAEGTWTFPAAFTSAFVFWGSATIPMSGSWRAHSVLWGADDVGATTSAAWYLFQDGGTSSSTAGFESIFLLALGRWN